jgi:hypothetical protein
MDDEEAVSGDRQDARALRYKVAATVEMVSGERQPWQRNDFCPKGLPGMGAEKYLFTVDILSFLATL